MLDILTASTSVGAWKCEPMTVAQIDAHPDRDRIWATIKAMQDGQAQEMEVMIEYHEDEVESARSDGADENFNLGRDETFAEVIASLEFARDDEGRTSIDAAIDVVRGLVSA